MEQRSSRDVRRADVRDPLPCDWEKGRRHNRDEQLCRNYSVQNHNVSSSKISMDGYMDPYRKSMPTRAVRSDVQHGELPRRRGSVYQSSQEMRKLKILQDQRRNIELSNGSDGFFSFDIVGSSTLCGKNEEERCIQGKKSTQAFSQEGLTSTPSNPANIGARNSSEFLDLSFRVLLEEPPKETPSVMRRDNMLDDLLGISLLPDDNRPLTTDRLAAKISNGATKLKGKDISGLKNNVSDSLKRGKMQTLAKSLSTKVSGMNSHAGEDSAPVKPLPKTRFGPFMRMLDPLVKSKSLRSQVILEGEGNCLQAIDCEKSRRVAAETSFSTDAMITSSGTEKNQKIDCKEPILESVGEAAILLSPVHLNGTLKLESKQKASPFVFSLNDLGDVYYSKTWRTGSPFEWVYTFHSHRRKSCISSRGMRESQKPSSPMIGQMQVSCYLCSEVGSTGSMDNYTVLEFVLYDISQARRSSVSEGRNCHAVDTPSHAGDITQCTQQVDAKELENLLDQKKVEKQHRQSAGDCDIDTTDSHPLAPVDLLSNLEIAAIAIQIPFDDKERGKDASTCDIFTKRCSGIQKGFSVHQDKGRMSNNLYPVNMKVVAPSGRHGLPSAEGCPSSLLYRWRSGGRCDCGGWDMACPITVLTANSTDHGTEFSLKKGNQSLRLDVEGSKDAMPAFLIKLSAEGEYSVNFHAQFSSLQAFAISIATVHLLEYFRPNYQENMPILHSNSLKLLLEEEVRQLLDVVAEEEKRNVKRRVVRPTPLYCLLDPPFSPMSRV